MRDMRAGRKRLARATPLLLGLLLGRAAVAQDQGFAAYEAGRFEEALRLLLPHAESDHARAQYVVGLMYAAGQGIEQSFYEAAKMYRKAAHQGHAGAQVNLGSLYEHCYGNGPCNTEAAADWYRKAAAQGDATGQFNLAVMYAAGRGVGADEWRAKVLFRKSAEQGFAAAQYNLGVAYERGLGGPVDRIAACAWYELAAGGASAEGARARDRLAAGLPAEERERAASLGRRLRDLYSGR